MARFRIVIAGALGACVALAPTIASACSACGCTLSSDWASQGLAATGGWRADVRLDYFNQDQLRSGTDVVARSSLEIPNEEEVQQYTINRNYTFAVDYSPNRSWGIGIALPWYNRAHATIAEGDAAISTSHDTGIGDLRIVARYSGFGEQRQTGLQFGLKLPTGRFTSTFQTGPQQGEPLDRGLQLGTGTYDLIVGAYHFDAISQDWGYFAQAFLTQPLGSRDGFHAGTGLNANLGFRYTANDRFVPQLQLNARVEKRESGASADVENSGATLVYASPGATWNLSRRFSAYGFVQAPIYQRVNGLQIETRWLASVGLHYIF